MRAARVHDYDSPAGLTVDVVDVPVPGPDQLLVRVRAASVNPVDWKMRDGLLRAFMRFDLPVTLGGDFAGEVAAVGADVAGFAVGDAVHGMTDSTFRYAHGGFADYVAVTAANVAPKPASLDFAHAAAVPLAALTAWQALHDRGRVQPGQRVLIHAAAGGVGSFAVQFARAAGAYVIGTASARNLDHVLALGADEVVDYTVGPFEDRVRDVDLVIDLIGEDVQPRSMTVMKPGGTLVNAWGALDLDAAARHRVTAVKTAVTQDGPQLRTIDALMDAGVVRVGIAKRFPFQEVGEALALSRTGRTRGKIVLELA